MQQNHTVSFLLVTAITTFAATGCSKSPPAGPAIAPAAAAEAAQIFAQRCSPCHGPEGRGDGAASASLTPKPRNLSLSGWQSSVDDAHISRVIREGGAAVGKSPMMPPNPDLQAKPEIVAALVAHVRGLGRR